MKRALLYFIPLLYLHANAQTNSFPPNGSAGIGTTNPTHYEHGGINKVLEIKNEGTGTHSQSHLILSTNSVNPSSSIGSITWAVPAALGTKGVGFVGVTTSSSSTATNPTGEMMFATRGSTDPYWMERMRISNDGNLGVGTVTPAFKLDVNGSNNITGKVWHSYGSNIAGYSWTNAALTTNSIEIVNNNGNVSNSSPTLVFHRYGSGGPQFRLAADGSNVLYLESAYENSSRQPNPTTNFNYFHRFHVAGAFTAADKLGVGTQSPNTKLQVNSMNDGTGSTDWIAGNFGGTGGDRVVMGILFGKATIGAHNNSLNSWSTLSINPDGGFVGIGTLNPTEMLSVKGKIRAHEIKVETQNWPDYVFSSNHKKPSLSELESYIKANNHLPEIPNAKEAESEGISLGEMNKKLLQKIEELTLYAIDQNKGLESYNKKLEEQQELIQALQKEVQELKKHIK